MTPDLWCRQAPPGGCHHADVTVGNWIPDECLLWIQNQNIEGFGIPLLVPREICDVLVENLCSRA